MGILNLQHLACPLCVSQVIRGRLRYQGIRCLHFGQLDGGRITDWSKGIRKAQTLMKLPNRAPMTKPKRVVPCAVPRKSITI